MGHEETPPERYMSGDYLDSAWALAQSAVSGSFVRHLVYDDRLVQDEGRRYITRPIKDIVSDLIGALDIQISTEVASKYYGNTAGMFPKQVVMVVPTRWSGSLKDLAWQVRYSLS